jgi:VWFA-related protein
MHSGSAWRFEKMKPRMYRARNLVMVAAAVILAGSTSAYPRQQNQQRVETNNRDVTILVTVHPHDEQSRAQADKLEAGDFRVREEGRVQQIISAKRAAGEPTILAVLLQDDLVTRVNNEIAGIKEFIRRLPDGSRVMTGYLTAGSLRTTQEFTRDRERAAESLRIVVGSSSASPFNPYIPLIEALKQFDSQPAGRRIVLFVSDGLDVSRGFRSASPMLSLDLDRAIKEAQRRRVSVFSFFAPSVGLTSVNHLAVNFGQGSLNRLADETGGEAFLTGRDFVTFAPYFRELNELMGRQWLITYRSTNTGSGFRRIEVTNEYRLHLYHATGYRVRDADNGNQ